ncbi:MAG: sigma-70 family RNA polymerase sigma factor [Planctomycetota bacterium]|nr:MAG: sigma-70 family RNA polymerase sigma factor [Planctomycetota bacterium]
MDLARIKEYTDEEILLLCQNARAEERKEYLEIIIQRYSQRLYHYIYRMIGNPYIAEDLVQDTFLNLVKNLNKYKEVAKVSTWLFKIAINITLNHIRSQKVRSAVQNMGGVGEEEEDYMEILARDESQPWENLEQRELESMIQRALLELPEKYRTLLILCDIEGLNYDEISQILGLKLGTVKSRINRGREKLALLLEDMLK